MSNGQNAYVEIPLANSDRCALVDAGEELLVDGFRWRLHATGYVTARRGGEMFYLHRVLLGLAKGDPREGDHRNGDKLDHRRENLRIVTHAQNGENIDRGRGPLRGVSFHKHRRKWIAKVQHNGTAHHAGYHDTPEQAAAAACAKRAELLTHAVEERHAA